MKTILTLMLCMFLGIFAWAAGPEQRVDGVGGFQKVWPASAFTSTHTHLGFCDAYLVVFASDAPEFSYSNKEEKVVLVAATRCFNYVQGVRDATDPSWTRDGTSSRIKVAKWYADTDEIIKAFVAFVKKHPEMERVPAADVIREAGFDAGIYSTKEDVSSDSQI